MIGIFVSANASRRGELVKSLDATFSLSGKKNSRIDKQLSYILFNDKKNYGTRLLDSLTKVIFSN